MKECLENLRLSDHSRIEAVPYGNFFDPYFTFSTDDEEGLTAGMFFTYYCPKRFSYTYRLRPLDSICTTSLNYQVKLE